MTARTADYAAIEVGGLFLDSWQEYSFDSDLFTPADAFRLSIGIGSSSSRELKQNLDKLRENIYAGAVVKFYVGAGSNRALQGTGIIDAREIENSEDGTTFSCEGRDFAAYLVDSAAPADLYKQETPFVDVCRKACKPWGIKVNADAAADREVRTGKQKKALPAARTLQDRGSELGIPARKLSTSILDAIDAGTLDPASLGGISVQAIALSAAKISPLQIYALRAKEAAPQSGETVWEFLDRHAKRLGIMMRMGPTGTLTLTGLDYGQQPLVRLTRRMQQAGFGTKFSSIAMSENNILSGGERYDASRLYKQVTVHGRAPGASSITLDDLTSDGDAKPVKGIARDSSSDAIPHEKTLVIHDTKVRSNAEAEKRAYRELAKSRQGAQILNYTMKGHGQSGTLYATDTIAHVEDDIAGVSGPFYVVGRTFTRSKSDGPRTHLKLVPLGSIVLGDG